jgi:hypothetical protein
MNPIKNHLDKPKNEKNKHGGAQLESMLIKKYADKWCIDNGYPLTKRIIKRGRCKERRINERTNIQSSDGTLPAPDGRRTT